MTDDELDKLTKEVGLMVNGPPEQLALRSIMCKLMSYRVGKLLLKGKRFIVVACDESYFADVYQTIREAEKKKGRWTPECEWVFQEVTHYDEATKEADLSASPELDTLIAENLPDPSPCFLVIQYRTFHQRWLRAICTTRESAELQKLSVQVSIDSVHPGCERDDKVFIEASLLDHLYGGVMQIQF